MSYVLCVVYLPLAVQARCDHGMGIKRSGRRSQLIAKLLMPSEVSLGEGLTVEESTEVLTGPDVPKAQIQAALTSLLNN